jgi:hypothetical protein
MKTLLFIFIFSNIAYCDVHYWEHIIDKNKTLNSINFIYVHKDTFVFELVSPNDNLGRDFNRYIGLCTKKDNVYTFKCKLVIERKGVSRKTPNPIPTMTKVDVTFKLTITGFIATLSDDKGNAIKFISIIPDEQYIDNSVPKEEE